MEGIVEEPGVREMGGGLSNMLYIVCMNIKQERRKYRG